MSAVNLERNEHDHFRELSALSLAGNLRPEEMQALQEHLASCRVCARVHQQFEELVKQGMPALNEEFRTQTETVERWDGSDVQKRLLMAMDAEERRSRSLASEPQFTGLRSVATALMAASVLVVVCIGSFRAGARRASAPVLAEKSSTNQPEKVVSAAIEPERISEFERLQKDAAQNASEVIHLKQLLVDSQSRIDDLTKSKDQVADQLKEERAAHAALVDELRQKEESYGQVRDDLDRAQQRYGESTIQLVALESEIQTLKSRGKEKDQAVAERDAYLSSDRDIRELMGARQLYIADVFDVDNSGKPRRAFGRVFYTKNKSLVFYAFDLDQQPHVRDASAFQVWGERGFGNERPLNLGVLYMDNEANHRWVLRSDDPAKLAEIDAVFVTVEPNGGSAKPTGRQLLYASLRKPANHP